MGSWTEKKWVTVVCIVWFIVKKFQAAKAVLNRTNHRLWKMSVFFHETLKNDYFSTFTIFLELYDWFINFRLAIQYFLPDREVPVVYWDLFKHLFMFDRRKRTFWNCWNLESRWILVFFRFFCSLLFIIIIIYIITRNWKCYTRNKFSHF